MSSSAAASPSAPAPGAGKKRAWITANQVTLARLIPMPFISLWLYQGSPYGGHAGNTNKLWTALIVGTIIGCTDFVDGWLARRQGPTVLGGLLDPIADKVFIAFVYLPFADVGLIPAWAVALMFVREFFVTALRSAYEQRDLSLKTSYLAKAKTWTQMQGIGIVLLLPLIGDRPLMTYIIYVIAIVPLVGFVAMWLIKRRFWKGALAMSAVFWTFLIVHLHGDPKFSMYAIMVGIVGITWLSGFDYIMIGYRQLRGRGDFRRADFVRLLGGFVLPGLLVAVMVRTPVDPWPVLTILSVELSVGGLDNLLSHHKVASGAMVWGARVIGISILLGAALLLPAQAELCSIAAAVLSVVGVASEFWRGRDYFVDRRIRDKAIRDAAAAS